MINPENLISYQDKGIEFCGEMPLINKKSVIFQYRYKK